MCLGLIVGLLTKPLKVNFIVNVQHGVLSLQHQHRCIQCYNHNRTIDSLMMMTSHPFEERLQNIASMTGRLVSRHYKHYTSVSPKPASSSRERLFSLQLFSRLVSLTSCATFQPDHTKQNVHILHMRHLHPTTSTTVQRPLQQAATSKISTKTDAYRGKSKHTTTGPIRQPLMTLPCTNTNGTTDSGCHRQVL